MNKYIYNGPVMYFRTCIQQKWTAYTTASSESKAINNLTYRYKKEHGFVPNAKIILTGKVVLEQKGG